MRVIRSSSTGKISSTSPRTRNVPRVRLRSLRVELHVHQPPQQPVAVVTPAACSHLEGESLVLLRGAEPVDAGDAGDDDHIPALEQRLRGEVAQPVDLLVDRGVLLDVGVGLREVRLGLVVVVVGRRSSRPRCRGRTRGTPRRAGPRASCCARSPASGAAPARSRWRCVNVLPEPVTPSSVCRLWPSTTPWVSLLDRLRLIALGLVIGDQLELLRHGISLRAASPALRRTADTITYTRAFA